MIIIRTSLLECHELSGTAVMLTIGTADKPALFFGIYGRVNQRRLSELVELTGAQLKMSHATTLLSEGAVKLLFDTCDRAEDEPNFSELLGYCFGDILSLKRARLSRA